VDADGKIGGLGHGIFLVVTYFLFIMPNPNTAVNLFDPYLPFSYFL